jgi:hypothetical protein
MKVLMLGESCRSSSAPIAMSRSINSNVGRSCRDCALQRPPQLSTYTFQEKLVRWEQMETLRAAMHLICDDFRASECTLILSHAYCPSGIGSHLPVLKPEIDLL